MKRLLAEARIAFLLLGASLAAAPLRAATFVVDSTGDGAAVGSISDGVCDAQPGGAVICTLRAAIQEANGLAGTDVINFAIGTGLAIISPGSALPTITTRVTIDGTTQPGYAGTPIIELNGASAGGANALTLSGAGSSMSTIRGLVIDRFGGTAIRIVTLSANNVIAGNYLGTDPTGTLTGRGNAVGVYVTSSSNRIGGAAAADRNVISGNTVDGIQIDGAGATGTLLQGNYIGLNAAGTAPLGNSGQGVSIFNSADNNTIGGAGLGEGNVISANANGVAINGAGTTGNLVQGNFIGTDWTGTMARGNTMRGVTFDASSANNTVGGTAPGAGNRIAHNGTEGVWLGGGTLGIAIQGNAIFSNGGLGIDLAGNGFPELNDAGDADTGSNTLQNQPALTAAITNGAGSAYIGGSLHSAPSTAYRVEFFASAAADPFGYGEGERYLGFTDVTTNAAGNVLIGVSLAASLTAGEVVTATATNPSNNTSEFGGARVAVGSLIVTTTADTVDGNTTSVTTLIGAAGADGGISLREAILATNATAGTDTIRFGIPLGDPNHRYYRNDAIAGSLTNVQPTTLGDSLTPSAPAISDFDPDCPSPRSWYRIQPTSALPTITDAVVLDGSSQPGFVAGGPVIELDGSSAGAAANGLELTGSNSTLRGIVIHSFENDGVRLISGDFNLVVGNFVGTDVSGKLDRGNVFDGIEVSGGSSNNTIGGTTSADRNLLSGNTEAGLQLNGALTSGNVVLGNYIGTDVTGASPLANAGPGIALSNGTQNNRIGGPVPGSANVIAHNTRDGVRFFSNAGSGNAILANSIFSNGENGIDLNNDGVTTNDAGDVDAGPNSLLNFPFGTAALESGGNLTVYFKLDLAAGWYRVELFKNPAGADPSGNGEGQLFAGSTNVNHPGGGTANFSHVIAGAVGDVITTTATACTDGATCAALGDTSEFGNTVTAVPTAVTLSSFIAVPLVGAVDVLWTTGSELNNLGFHLYRSGSASGPFERITQVVIPGLGSSPVGGSYSHRDSGVENGVTYFYQLEDIETTGRTTLHGPVSATPEESHGWTSDEERVTHGNPSEVLLRVVERGANGVLLELVTGGFFAMRWADGTYRLEVPGFEELETPSLPMKRTWLEAVSGRGARIISVRPFEVTRYSGLRPSSGSLPEIVATPEGTVRAGTRRIRETWRGAGIVPASAARIVQTGFQGEVKRALVELAPLRWDEGSGELLWARRLEVRVSFSGIDSREERHRESRSHRSRKVLAQLSTTRPGLYRVPLIEVFPGRSGSLRLSRRGEPVAYHLEPPSLYFLGEADAVYELERGEEGTTMSIEDASPSGPPVSFYLDWREWEEDRFYQAGLLEAPSLWLWDLVLSPGSKTFPFTVSALADPEAKLEVYLQGASDFAAGADHHVRLSINGIVVGEASWDGKAAKTIQAALPPAALREGENELSVENVGDAGPAHSMVFLDRFALTFARKPIAENGRIEGRFTSAGAVAVEGIGERSLVLQTAPSTKWLQGTNGGAFRVEPGRRYLAASPEAVLEAKIRRPRASVLRSPRNRADYLLIAPAEFLPAAEPLIERRRSQKLIARAVAIEEIYDEFGYGEARPEALKDFLSYAYHHWRKPSVRYVVLLGDATYDAKDRLRTGVVNRVPALMMKTSYLWTASDPGYAAVNGPDGLPDFALGRLPAANLAEAFSMVSKVLAYEDARRDFSGPAVLVADDPDAAGDFEEDSEEIAAKLHGQGIQRIYLRELGPSETRRAIAASLDRGASLLSYVGHGGIALWANENVFQSSDVRGLRPQDRQPILMTMNCLNGYFHFPYFDSLAEAFVKAEGKGAAAAFSPSGLSLNGPAHLYQQALVGELTSSRHLRLGDAVLAAQRTYGESGAFPELLAIYHLFGDPALVLR